MANPVASLFHF
jgi:hypothetical protein